MFSVEEAMLPMRLLLLRRFWALLSPARQALVATCSAFFYDSTSKTVKGLNGSGRAPRNLSIEHLKAKGYNGSSLPDRDVNTVTVPGAAAGWIDTVERFGNGNLPLIELLLPAIELAEKGFAVGPVTASQWATEAELLRTRTKNAGCFLVDGMRAPRPGEVMTNPELASVMRALATSGKKSFYEGEVAQAIVSVVQELGGVLDLDDMKSHASSFVDPIKLDYCGATVWEIPPNGQGLVVLIALNILKHFDLPSLGHNTPEYLHVIIEALRLAFADATTHIADPACGTVPVEQLLSEGYGKQRAALITAGSASESLASGLPFPPTDTVYVTVADQWGNCCSFISSIYMSFGSGVVPPRCGFSLQNRGLNFTLDPKHANCLAPGKRPYHTIIPAMATQNTDWWLCFGVVGGFMQPQGQVQVLANMIHFNMDPQEALDSPRVCLRGGPVGKTVLLEKGIDPTCLTRLAAWGHQVEMATEFGNMSTAMENGLESFGRGQVIEQKGGVLGAGTDPRADGVAVVW